MFRLRSNLVQRLVWSGALTSACLPGANASAGPALSRRDATGETTGDPILRDAPAFKPGVRDPGAGLPGPWERAFARFETRLDAGRPGAPSAVAGVLGVVDTLSGEIDSERLLRYLEGIANDRRRDPLVRAEAARSASRVLDRVGRSADAQRLLEDQGWVLGWQLLGPFENAGRSGHDAVYGPETVAFSPAQTFEGKLPLEPLSWQAQPAADSARGYVSFDERISPNVHVTGYASAWIYLPTSQSVTMHVGSGGAYKLWVDGDLVGSNDVYRQPKAIQDGHTARLSGGWHRVLIKLGVEEGLWGFFLRVSDRKGRPVKGMRVDGGLAAPEGAPLTASRAPSEGGASPSADRARTLHTALSDAANARRPDKVAQVALGHLLRWQRPVAPEDPTPTTFARELDAALETPESAWLASFLVQDFNEARALIVQGIARAEADPRADRGLLAEMTAELARRDEYLGLQRRADEGFARASEISPDDVNIEYSRLLKVYGEGLSFAALRWVEDMIGRYPESLTMQLRRADLLLEQGRRHEVLELITALQARHPGDGTLRARHIDLLLSFGRVEDAVQLARERALANPTRPSNWTSLARLQVGASQPEEAARSMARAVALSPLNAEYHRMSGVVLTDQGRVEEGLLALRRSLELRPQQPAVQDLIAVLDPQVVDDLLARYDTPLESVLIEGPTPARWDGKDAAVLHQMEAVRMLENGLAERMEHRVIQVLDERGVRSQAVQVVNFDPSESYVEVRRARVRRATGEIEELGETSVASMVEAGYRMFYDKRQLQVRFPSLRVGDVIEVVFSHRAVARRNIFDDYFGDIMLLGGNLPTERLSYVLEAPSDRPLFFNVDVAQTVRADDDVTVYTVTREALPGLKPEASMPGWSELFEFVHVSTFKDWASVGAWYWDLVKGQLVINDEIRAGVQEALASIPRDASRRQQVAAIYRHVVRNTRYVGLEFGIHGYKPYRTTEVFDRRFGDCKDKASLLKVMLKEAGIDSHLVLVRTRDQGSISGVPASLAAFNHAIVYVPEFELFLDGTAEWAGDTELPAGDQGASVLIVRDGDGATFQTIPMARAESNGVEASLRVELDATGGANVRREQTIRGTEAAGQRALFEARDARLDNMVRILGQRYPGAEVERATFEGLEDILLPVKTSVDYRVPQWANVSEEGVRFNLRGSKTTWVRSLASQVRRTHTLVLGVPFSIRRRVTVRPPDGQVFIRGPRDVALATRFGRLDLRATQAPNEASYTVSLAFDVSEVTPEEYPAFRAFLEQVDEALAQVFETEVAR